MEIFACSAQMPLDSPVEGSSIVRQSYINAGLAAKSWLSTGLSR